jgi:hypothetical protein
MSRRLLRGRIRPRTACIALLTLGFAGLVVLPEAVSASGLTDTRPATVPAGLDARRAVVLRPHRLDLVDGGRVVTSVPFDGTRATLAGVAAAVGDGTYLTRSRHAVTLRAALVQRPDTSLTVGTDGVRTVQLVSRPGAGAYVEGTGAAVTLIGVTVRADASTPAPVRPYLRYAGGSRVIVRGGTFTGLGRPSPHRAALELGSRTRAWITGTRFTGNETGLAAHGCAGVYLRHVTVTGSAADGLTLRDAGVVDAAAVRVARNKRNGLVVAGSGTRVRSLRDVGAAYNGHAGLMVTEGAAPAVVGLRTAHDGNAGAVLRGAGRVSLSAVATTAEPTGVRVQDGRPATISNLVATLDGTAVNADGRGYGLVVQHARIRRAKVGLRIQTPAARLSGLDVFASDIGVQSGPAARGLTVSGLNLTGTVAGTGTGLVSGGAAARLTGVHATGQRTGIRVEGAATTITGSSTDAAGSGVLLAGTATDTSLTGVTAHGGDEGVRVTTGADRARVVDSTISGGTGLRIGARDVTVTGGSIQADGTAMVIDTDAGDVDVSRTGIHGEQEGVRMAAGAGHLTLDHAEVTDAARTALVLDAGTTQVVGSTLSATRTAVDAAAPIALESSSITGAVGVRVAEGVLGSLVGTQVHARDVGVLATPGAHVTLTASQVYGAVPVRGSATLRGRSFVAAMPLNWLGIAGIGLVAIAVLLMLAARLRERGPDHVALAPAHVVNRA